MAQIANARHFAGVNDAITLGLGTLGFAFGPGTMALILRSTTVTGQQGFLDVGSATSARYAIWHENVANLSVLSLENNTSFARGPASMTVVDNEWVLMAVTKATGSVAPRMHEYVYSTTTWTHADSATALADSSVPTGKATIGTALDASLDYTGDIAVAGVWDNVLTDLELEGLTANIAAWEALTPNALWLLDQPVTSNDVLDRTGNGANQTALTATTVVAVSNLPFDVGGTRIFRFFKFPKKLMLAHP